MSVNLSVNEKTIFSKFKKQKVGFTGFLFVILVSFIALFAYILAPDKSENANQMHLSIHSKEPGFNTTMLSIPLEKDSQKKLIHYFTGTPNTTSEIPISSYFFKENQLFYYEYSSAKKALSIII